MFRKDLEFTYDTGWTVSLTRVSMFIPGYLARFSMSKIFDNFLENHLSPPNFEIYYYLALFKVVSFF